MKILLVEDDEAILDSLAFCLKKEGFEIEKCTLGREYFELY